MRRSVGPRVDRSVVGVVTSEIGSSGQHHGPSPFLQRNDINVALSLPHLNAQSPDVRYGLVAIVAVLALVTLLWIVRRNRKKSQGSSSPTPRSIIKEQQRKNKAAAKGASKKSDKGKGQTRNKGQTVDKTPEAKIQPATWSRPREGTADSGAAPQLPRNESTRETAIAHEPDVAATHTPTSAAELVGSSPVAPTTSPDSFWGQTGSEAAAGPESSRRASEARERRTRDASARRARGDRDGEDEANVEGVAATPSRSRTVLSSSLSDEVEEESEPAQPRDLDDGPRAGAMTSERVTDVSQPSSATVMIAETADIGAPDLTLPRETLVGNPVAAVSKSIFVPRPAADAEPEFMIVGGHPWGIDPDSVTDHAAGEESSSEEMAEPDRSPRAKPVVGDFHEPPDVAVEEMETEDVIRIQLHVDENAINRITIIDSNAGPKEWVDVSPEGVFEVPPAKRKGKKKKAGKKSKSKSKKSKKKNAGENW